MNKAQMNRISTWAVLILMLQKVNCAVLQKQLRSERNPRLSVVDWTNYNYHEPEGPGTYAFGYDIEDPGTSNVQFRNEERHPNGTVTGSYGYVEPDGNVHVVNYIADHMGYRATVENSLRGGQLRPVLVQGLPELTAASSISPQLISAVKSQGLYKNQKIHEDRTRPISQDIFPLPIRTRIITPSIHSPLPLNTISNSNEFGFIPNNNQDFNHIASDLYETDKYDDLYERQFDNSYNYPVFSSDNGGYEFYYKPNP